ncbi:Inactive hydroxysteroid dehydrogenase-like protein 1 [Geodia barretti]|uniref:Inactive hydroxysteroid dehydrogenase-like protein 1 n=1 Tax=Geodia barretti TaxID=519541 RepID=A0AA35RME9_GEOBA|nr:Inactive hydroxysteroid dehydrogenase-like protein 1 [Geodia barretti]
MEFATQAWDLFMSDCLYPFRAVATGVGVVYLLKTVCSTLCFLCPFIKAYVLAPLGIFRPNLKKYGPWAVVTGASEGIGRAYAIQLAKRGLNVVIMSRSREKLEKVADEIKKYGVEVRIIPVDFSSGAEIYPEIKKQLQDLEIGLLGERSQQPLFNFRVTENIGSLTLPSTGHWQARSEFITRESVLLKNLI